MSKPLFAGSFGTGLKGLPVAEIVKRFYGDLYRWPIEPDGKNATQAEILALAQHIHKTGDCLWHAQHVVFGWLCHCSVCMPSTTVKK